MMPEARPALGGTPFRILITLKVLLQSFGLGHKAAGLISLGRKCNRHHADYLAALVPQTFSWMDLGTGS